MNETYDLLPDIYDKSPYCFCCEKKKNIFNKIMIEIKKILDNSLNNENDELYQMINYTSLKIYPCFSIMYDKLMNGIIKCILNQSGLNYDSIKDIDPEDINFKDKEEILADKIYDMLKIMISSLTRYNLIKFTTIKPTINSDYTDEMVALIMFIIKNNTILTMLNNHYDLLPINDVIYKQCENLKYDKTLRIIKL